MTERAPAAVCGENTVFPAKRLGCGQRIETCHDVYRCTHCTTPFHRQCADKHFGAVRPAYNPAAIAYQVLLAQERTGFNPDHQPGLQPAFIRVAEKFLRHWRDLLVSSPDSAGGPLASLLADTVHETRAMVVGPPQPESKPGA